MNIALDDFVQRNIACCMSSIIYDIGQHPDEAAKVFELNTEGIYDWFSVLDYEAAIYDALAGLDFDELLDECDAVGYSSDALLAAGYDERNPPRNEMDSKPYEPQEWFEGLTDTAQGAVETTLRRYITEHIVYDDKKQELFERHGVDLDYFTCEVCELSLIHI